AVIGANGSSGSVSITAGATWTNNGSLNIGANSTGSLGTGVLTIDGGTVSVGGTMKIWDSSTTGVYLNSGMLIVNAIAYIGNASRLHWTGGTLLVGGTLTVDSSNPPGGLFNINNGQTLSINAAMVINSGGNVSIQSGGTLSSTNTTLNAGGN